MATRECDTLLKLCGPDIYRRNAFRLLAVDVDTKGRRIKTKERDLQAALAVDDLADEYSGALRPDTLPTREQLSQAGQVLSDAPQRFVHAFFWYWPLEWGESDSDKALKFIKANKLTMAQKSWEQIAASGGNASLVAKHNLAVLAHLRALDLEQKALVSTGNGELTRKKQRELDSCWSVAFKHWESLCSDEAFWSVQADRIRALGDPRLTTGFLRRFSQTLPIAFDNINADLAVAYCDREMYDRARKHIQIMKESNAGDDDIGASLRRVTAPLHGRIDQAVKTATYRLSQNMEEGEQRCTELLETVKGILQQLETLLGEESKEYVDACDHVAGKMLQCQVTYGNATEDWNTSLDLLEATRNIVRGPQATARVEKNLEIVRTNLETARTHQEIDPIIGRIDRAVRTAKSQLGQNAEEGRQQCEELLETVQGLLQQLAASLGEESQEYVDVCDYAADQMLQCQVTYGNATKDWNTSLVLLEAIREVVRGTKVTARVEENLRIVRNNNKGSACWFCDHGSREEEYAVKVTLTKPIRWREIKEHPGQYSDLLPKMIEQVLKQIMDSVSGEGVQLNERGVEMFKAAFEAKTNNDLDAMARALDDHFDDQAEVVSQQVTTTVPRCRDCSVVHSGGRVETVGAIQKKLKAAGRVLHSEAVAMESHKEKVATLSKAVESAGFLRYWWVAYRLASLREHQAQNKGRLRQAKDKQARLQKQLNQVKAGREARPLSHLEAWPAVVEAEGDGFRRS